jgi:ferredoxin/coenzyme F420-reducing hydrogenase delta subunit
MSTPIRPLRRLIRTLDAAATRAYGWRWNPFHQSGTLAVAMLLVLLLTGLYLILFYRLGAPFASVERMARDPWLGSWMRSLHRYATDLFILASFVHALRMLAQRRSWGPRTLAWISGLFLLGFGLVCAWTGYVMAWDSFGERLALEGSRLFDALPIFSEPLSRIFSGETAVPTSFFFVNLFVHIAVPLAVGGGLWLHVSRVARSTLLPPRRVTWGAIALLFVLSLLLPAPLGAGADSFRLATGTPLDVFAAGWLLVSERLPATLVWGLAVATIVAGLLVPRLTRKPRTGSLSPSVVDPRLCTGCNQCVQDCPWEAIALTERDDDRPTLVARVNPDRCVSCGICAGSCAPMGVGPPGRTGRDQLAAVRAEVLPQLGAGPSRPIVAICCAEAPPSHRDALRERGAFILPVSCAGNLHSSVVELLIRDGVPGVMVAGCSPRDCLGREGPKWLEQRLFHDREAELRARVDRHRVRTTTLAPGDLAGTLAAFDAFRQAVGALDAPVPEPGPLEAECEVTLAGDPA